MPRTKEAPSPSPAGLVILLAKHRLGWTLETMSDRSGVPWRTLYNHERGTHQAMHRTTATLLHRALSRAGLQVSIEQLQGAR